MFRNSYSFVGTSSESDLLKEQKEILKSARSLTTHIENELEALYNPSCCLTFFGSKNTEAQIRLLEKCKALMIATANGNKIVTFSTRLELDEMYNGLSFLAKYRNTAKNALSISKLCQENDLTFSIPSEFQYVSLSALTNSRD